MGEKTESLKHRIRNSQGAEFIRRLVSLYDGVSVVETPSGDQVLVARDPRSPIGLRAESLTSAGFGEGFTYRDLLNNSVDPLFRPFQDSGFRVSGRADVPYPASDAFLGRKPTKIPSIRRAFVGASPRPGMGRTRGLPTRRATPRVGPVPRFVPVGGNPSVGFPLKRNRPRSFSPGFPSPTFGPSEGKYRCRWDGPFSPLGFNYPFLYDLWGPVEFRYEIQPNTPFEVAVVYHHGAATYPRLQPPIAPVRQVLPVNGGAQDSSGIFRVPKELYRFSFVDRPPNEEDLERLMPSAFQPEREERIPAAPLLIPGYRPVISPSLPQRENDSEDKPATYPGRIPSPFRRKDGEDEEKIFNPPIPGIPQRRFAPPRRREEDRERRRLPRIGRPGRENPRRSRPNEVDWDKILRPYRIPQPWESAPRDLQPGLPPTRAVRIYFPPSRLAIPVRELELEGLRQPVRPPLLLTVPECRYYERNLSGKLFAKPCGLDLQQEFAYSGTNFKGLESQIAALSEKLDSLLSALCDRPAIAATPEWWQLRPGSDRPQLILLFAPSPRPGTPRESAKWQISIPHYSGGRLSASPVPTYTKGNCMGRLLLKDGSAVIVNCVDESECQRVLGLLQPLIDPAFVSGASIAISYRLGKPIQEKLMVACYARYYSSGQNSGIPDWYTRFD